MNEEWKPIKGYEEYYQISNFGKIKSIRRNIIKKTALNKRGYVLVTLYTKELGVKGFSVHGLVARHFIDNPNNLPEINHKDSNRQNNRFDNLEWSSVIDNRKHAHQNNSYFRWEQESYIKSLIIRYFSIYPQAKNHYIAKKLNLDKTTIRRIRNKYFNKGLN